MDDEDLPLKDKTPPAPKFEQWSIAELEAYLGALESQQIQIRALIDQKRSARLGAESFFKK